MNKPQEGIHGGARTVSDKYQFIHAGLCFDRFTSLDDLKKKDHGDPDRVLAALRSTGGRFSCFDIDTVKLGRTMDYLKRTGAIVYDKPQPGYPWCHVEIPEPA